MEFVYDEDQRLPENTFKRNGLMFAGWNTDAEERCRWYGDRAMVKNVTAAQFDIFRLQEGKIAEHWSNKEPVPARSELVNSGKF